MSTPIQQKALLLLAKQGDFAVQSRPVPTPGPGELLVRNEASGLNPVDWKIQAYGLFLKNYPAVLGSDAAGVIVAVGEGVPTWKVGDRVFVKVFFAGAETVLDDVYLPVGCMKAGSTLTEQRSSSTL